ncbi:MAG: hypothetical protein B7Z55_10280 [Planctomycetales bacterium 12-60-4]|nr:MAG: hypothetical protein B7Z55_10280 [Planctomycetales bacterium 12-60-4]
MRGLLTMTCVDRTAQAGVTAFMQKLILSCACGFFFAAPWMLSAQEMRVYTVTRAIESSSQNVERQPVLARSLTLFHAGKVYDYISSEQEVVIFEPAHHRFTILNESAAAVTVVSQDEIRRFLGLAEERAQEVAADLLRSPDPQQRQSVELLQFQLRPTFETTYEPMTRRLQMQVPQFAYDAVCAEAPQPLVVDSYLRYADAITELNSVLHPQSFLPAPRMALNQQLRERGILPISVRRRVEYGATLEIAAEHKWEWALTELDRKYIDRWESQISKGLLRPLSFEQMQRAVLTGKLSQR